MISILNYTAIQWIKMCWLKSRMTKLLKSKSANNINQTSMEMYSGNNNNSAIDDDLIPSAVVTSFSPLYISHSNNDYNNICKNIDSGNDRNNNNYENSFDRWGSKTFELVMPVVPSLMMIEANEFNINHNNNNINNTVTSEALDSRSTLSVGYWHSFYSSIWTSKWKPLNDDNGINRDNINMQHKTENKAKWKMNCNNIRQLITLLLLIRIVLVLLLVPLLQLN